MSHLTVFFIINNNMKVKLSKSYELKWEITGNLLVKPSI